MKNKKLGIVLLTLAVFTNVQAKNQSNDNNSDLYQPKSPWLLAPVEDAFVGTAGVLTLGQTDADPTGLVVAVPDAIPGVSYARCKDSDNSSCKKKTTKKKQSSKMMTKSKKNTSSTDGSSCRKTARKTVTNEDTE